MTSNLSRVTTQKNEDLTVFSEFPIKILYIFSTPPMGATCLRYLTLHGLTSHKGLKPTDGNLGLFNPN